MEGIAQNKQVPNVHCGKSEKKNKNKKRLLKTMKTVKQLVKVISNNK